ncbi:MAG: T9SS type A sorting domain-containing protein, partial [Bacteroidales bacterium]|nr:T9SS type A sorting domain-containing protein [Bacteroidales bacterium]
PQTSFYTYEEQADYLPFYVETDSTSDVQEIALLADGEVRGAAVRLPGDTLTEVNGYLEGVVPGAVIEFETWNGYKSEPIQKDGYVVIDHRRKLREKRTIYKGEKADYYHVSLKSNEVYNLPAEMGKVTCKPNPFRNQVEFSFRLNRAGAVKIEVLDITGKKVKTVIDGFYPAGYYSFTWQGENESGQRIKPGVYFYKVSTGNEPVQTDKIVMIK